MRRFAPRLFLPAALLAGFVAQFAHAYDYTAPVPLHTIANFDPSKGVVPFPNDLLRQGSKDLTLNIPVTDPATAGTIGALNALDGFGTISPWTTTFPAPLSASSVAGGVHFFEVTTDAATGAVTGFVRELKSPQEYVATLASNSATTGATLAIVPTAPLKQLTSYMAVLTNSLTDASGVSVNPSLIYVFTKRSSPLCVNGASTFPALPTAQACALEPLRQLTNTQLAAASAAGVNPGSVVLSWTATTQSTTVTMQALTGVVEAAPNKSLAVVPTGLNLSKINATLPPIADVYVGTLTIPYYLTAPCTPGAFCPADLGNCSNVQACPPLSTWWNAAPGAYVSPYDKAGLDPTSTNLTFANPLPVATSNQTIPVLLTVPNSSSGKTKPAAGWPIVIFQHGITRNRTDMFAVAGALASQGFAVVAIDLPLHGLTDPTNPFYHNQLLAKSPASVLITGERTFDIGTENAATGAIAAPIADSGTYFINLTSLLTSRDNLREGVADLLQLRSAIPSASLDGSTTAFDSTRVSFASQSLGSIEGTTFMSLANTPNTAVQNAVLNVPGGGIVGLLLGSPTFSPVILAGLGAAGITPGSAAFNTFQVAAQTAIDAGDPINYAADKNTGAVLAGKGLLVQEVVGGSAPLPGDISAAGCATCYDAAGNWLSDQVIPNAVATAPLSGAEPLIAVLGLDSITASILPGACEGGGSCFARGAVRFVSGTHGSILDPSNSPATTVEMQTEMVGFLASGGFFVPVNNIPPVVAQSVCFYTVGSPAPNNGQCSATSTSP